MPLATPQQYLNVCVVLNGHPVHMYLLYTVSCIQSCILFPGAYIAFCDLHRFARRKEVQSYSFHHTVPTTHFRYHWTPYDNVVTIRFVLANLFQF